MFLSMLTADAASQHGHEFSRRATIAAGQQPPRRLPIPRSPFSRSRSPHGPSPLGPGRAAPPARSQSLKITMAELREEAEEQQEEKEKEEDLRDVDTIIRSFTIPGAFHSAFAGEEEDEELDVTPSTVLESAEEYLPVSEPSIHVKAATPSESSTSEATDSTTSKRQPRPKSWYRFAHPPPTMRQKKGILRPKVLLQLQEKSNSGFHKPVVEVVPGSRYSARTKVGQKLQRFHSNKDGAHADDLVVIRCEGSSENSSEDTDIHDPREVVGIIQPGEDGPSAYITVDNSIWKAKLDGRGSYSLELANDPSQRVRWYIPKAKRSGTIETGSTVGREFSFTTLLPDSTKHPIVANMKESGMTIYDQFSSPLSPEDTITMDDALRRLIIVSGAWVFFCEGWSTHYDFNSIAQSRPMPNRSCSLPSSTLGKRSIRSPSRSPAPSVGGGETFATLAEGRSQEVSQSPQSTETSNVVPKVEIPVSIPKPIADPPPQPTMDVDTSELRHVSPVQISSSSDTAPRSEFTQTTEADEKARRRMSWNHTRPCPDLRYNVHDWHHRLGDLSRKVSTKAKTNTRRFSTHLPLRHRSLPEGDVHEAVEEEGHQKEKRFSHLKRISHQIRHSRDNDRAETLFQAEVLHVATLGVQEGHIYHQKRFIVSNHPNKPFLHTSEHDSSEETPVGSIETGDIITLATNPTYTPSPTTTLSIASSPVLESLPNRLPSPLGQCLITDGASPRSLPLCTRSPSPRGPHSTLSKTLAPLPTTLAALEAPTVPTTNQPPNPAGHERTATSHIPSTTSSRTSSRSSSPHDEHTSTSAPHGWWHQYDRFLHDSFEQEVDQELATPRRATLDTDAVTTPGTPASNKDAPALTMGARTPESEKSVPNVPVLLDGSDETVVVRRQSAPTDEELREEKKGRRRSGWGWIGGNW